MVVCTIASPLYGSQFVLCWLLRTIMHDGNGRHVYFQPAPDLEVTPTGVYSAPARFDCDIPATLLHREFTNNTYDPSYGEVARDETDCCCVLSSGPKPLLQPFSIQWYIPSP